MQMDLFKALPNLIEEGVSKVCKICKKEKNLKSFGSMRTNKDRTDTRCKMCVSSDNRIRNVLRKLHKDENTGECHCCGKKHHKTLVVDHCHVTDAYRGWLCEPCNFALGHLGDNIEGVEKALAYLRNQYER